MPARGQYDRGLTSAERWSKHRSELVRATAVAWAESGRGAFSVDAIVRAARKGRNTFYAHFGGLEQALRAVESTVVSGVSHRAESRMADAVTPAARLRAITTAWVEAARAEPVMFRAALHGPEGRCGELARKHLESFVEQAQRDGLFARRPEELRIAAAVGALLAAADAQLDAGKAIEDVSRAAAEVLIRILR